MDQRKDLTFCPKDVVFAFTPHNICDSLNNVGGRWEGDLSIFSEDEKLSSVMCPYGLAVSQKLLTFLDVNVGLKLPMASIDTVSLSTQIGWNSVCAYDSHFLPVLHFHVFCMYCPCSTFKLAQAARAIGNQLL